MSWPGVVTLSLTTPGHPCFHRAGFRNGWRRYAVAIGRGPAM